MNTSQPDQKKNVLLIISDEWRPDQLGMDPTLTPNYQALARDGVSFTSHYGQVMPCAPSRASIHTGLYAMTHRVVTNGSPLARHHRNFAQHMRSVGYSPMLFGYTDTAADPTGLSPLDPALLDFEGVLPGMSVGALVGGNPLPTRHDLWRFELRRLGYKFNHPKEVLRPDYSKPSGNSGVAGHPAIYAAEHSDTAFLTNQFISWLSEQDKAWCSMLCYLRPHPPFTAPAPYNSIVDPDSLPPMRRTKTWEDQAKLHPFMNFQLNNGAASETFHSLVGLARDISITDWMSVRAVYCGLMIEVDRHLGRVIEALKKSNHYDDTMIIFTSDHGDPIGDFWLGNQLSYHDIQAHLPLIIRNPSPGARKLDGTFIDSFTESVDFLPTLLDWLGQDIPTELDGMSLLPFLNGETPRNWRQYVHWEYNFPSPPEPLSSQIFGISEDECMMSVIRDKNFKHVFFPAQDPILIDVRNDPDELNNLGNEPKYAGVEREYLAEQLRLRILHADRRMSTTVINSAGLVKRIDERRKLRPILSGAG